MMAMREVLRPMDKGYLTADPAIVDMLDGALWGGFGRVCLSRTLLSATDRRGVKQLITLVQSSDVDEVPG
jgi:hypothetical protein